MTHKRQQIREQAVTLLTGLATTGARVFASRVYPIQRAELPGLLVYAKNEPSQRASMGGSLMRDLTLVVEAVARGADLDDTLDTICKEVEAAMTARLNGLAKDCYLAATDISYDGQGEQPHGVARMEFAVVYVTP